MSSKAINAESLLILGFAYSIEIIRFKHKDEKMKRRQFALTIVALASVGSLAIAGKKNKKNKGNRSGGHSRGNSRNRNGRDRNRNTITNKQVKLSGVLENRNGQLALSGNDTPFEIDEGLTFLAKKHVGKEVEVYGMEISNNGNARIKVRFIKLKNPAINQNRPQNSNNNLPSPDGSTR